MNKDKLKQLRHYALAGVKIEIEKLLADVQNLCETFPRMVAFGDARAALTRALEASQAHSVGSQYSTEPVIKRPYKRRVRVIANHKPETNGALVLSAKSVKPSQLAKVATPKRRNTGKHKALGAQRSWEAGRELLGILNNATEPMDVKTLMKRLHLKKDACKWRLTVRKTHGHVQCVDEVQGLWVITEDGRNAYKNDKPELLA
jgi:hypothetical protein